MEDNALVNVTWRGQAQWVVLYPGISSPEVQGILEALFQLGSGAAILGLKDAGTGIAYPVSYLTAHPTQFVSGSFELVVGGVTQKSPDDAPMESAKDFKSASNYDHTSRPFEQSTSNILATENENREDDMAFALERIALVRRTLCLEVIDSIQLKYLFLQSRDEDAARELSLASFMRCMGRLGAESTSRNSLIPLIFDVFVGASGKASIDSLTNGLSVRTAILYIYTCMYIYMLYIFIYIQRLVSSYGVFVPVLDILSRVYRREDSPHIYLDRYSAKRFYQVCNKLCSICVCLIFRIDRPNSIICKHYYYRQDDLAQYFEAVYAIIFQIVPDISLWINCPSAEAAGEMTAAHAFQFCADGALPSDRMDFDDFATWYRSNVGNYGINEFPIPMLEQSQMSFGAAGGSEVLDALDGLDVFQVQQELGLVNVPASNLTTYFKQFVDHSGNIPKEDFVRAFHELMEYMHPSLDGEPERQMLLSGIIDRIAAVYCIKGDTDVIDVRGFTSGMILFCGGDAESKAEAIFDAYQLSNRISRNILVAHMLSTFAMMNEFDAAFPSQEVSVNIAKELVDASFARLGLEGPDRSMSRSQFTSWLAAGEGAVQATSLLGASRSTRSEEDEDYEFRDGDDSSGHIEVVGEEETSDYDDSEEEETASQSSASSGEVSFSGLFTPSIKNRVKLEMGSARNMLGLQFFTADDLLDMVGEFSKEGVISSFSWFKVVSSMLTLSGRGDALSRKDTDPTLFLAQRIFNALDVHGVEAVNYADLVLALSNVCSSPIEDKVMVVFTLLDEAGAGFVRYDALLRYFVALYRVISVMSPSISELIDAMGVSIEAMARIALDGALRALNFSAHAELLLTLGEVSEILEYIVDRGE